MGGPYLVGNHTTLSVITTDGVEQCVGSLDGVITVNVNGGSGNYKYTWFGDGRGIVDGAKDQFALSRGNYQVTVTDVDNNNCSVTKRREG